MAKVKICETKAEKDGLKVKKIYEGVIGKVKAVEKSTKTRPKTKDERDK